MKIYNTLSGKKEPLPKPPRGKPLRLFVCGPTVYDTPHIGNARTYMVFDAFVRFLRSKRIRIEYLQNITDVDDKIILRAHEAKISPEALAQQFITIYREDMARAGITNVDRYASATKYIPQIIRQVETLIEKSYAYTIPHDGIYFEIAAFPHYGQLARRTALDAEDGTSRIDESESKRGKGDFCLWKFERSGEPSWKAPFGAGRPGWHIEDTAISEAHFGTQYEVHGGGVDLKFPHHEAEIAQQESASGKHPFVKLWMHVGALLANDKKMSKSLRNFVPFRTFLAQHPPDTFRLMVLRHHYRSPMHYTEALAEETERMLGNIHAFLHKLRFTGSAPKEQFKAIPRGRIRTFTLSFSATLEDDFNTPEAFATLFTFMNELQTVIYFLSKKDAREALRAIEASLTSLGLGIPKARIPSDIRGLLAARDAMRNNQQFIQSDALRKKIESVGYIIEDTPLGPLVFPKL